MDGLGTVTNLVGIEIVTPRYSVLPRFRTASPTSHLAVRFVRKRNAGVLPAGPAASRRRIVLEDLVPFTELQIARQEHAPALVQLGQQGEENTFWRLSATPLL